MKNLSYDLDGKVVVVTGGSRGIGLEIARLLLVQGARVVICGRKEQGLDDAAKFLGGGDKLRQEDIAAAVRVAEALDVTVAVEAVQQ